MRRWTSPRRIFEAAAALGLVAAAATVVATVALTRVYRPTPPGWDSDLHPGHPGRASDGWLGAHASASAILGMAAFAAFLVLVWPTGRPSELRRPLPVGLAALATLAAAAAIVTRDMLAFEQVALASVTVGTNLSGFWFAAFGDDVMFLLVDGSEVGQPAYARTLVVHLVAPVVAALTLLGAIVAVRRQSGGSST